MTERLADVSARIEGVRQLGAVVNAMKGIAAARASAARAQVKAVDSYAATISAAMSSALGPDLISSAEDQTYDPDETGLLVYCAEQGFAGAFSERVLDSISQDIIEENLFLIGTRGLSVAATRGVSPGWSARMPSHAPGIPKLADQITQAVYSRMEKGKITCLDVAYTHWEAGRPEVVRHTLLPIDRSTFAPSVSDRPLIQLELGSLLASLSADYLHALICKASLHAFAAENEARMEAMTAAGSQIASELKTFEATLRRVRQEAITAEIIELGTGALAARDAK